jgi:hypothetical protein
MYIHMYVYVRLSDHLQGSQWIWMQFFVKKQLRSWKTKNEDDVVNKITMIVVYRIKPSLW